MNASGVLYIYKIHGDFALDLNSSTLGTGTNVLNTNYCNSYTIDGNMVTRKLE